MYLAVYSVAHTRRHSSQPGLLIYRYASSGGEPELIKTGTYTTLGGIYHFCNRKELGVTVNKSEASFCENIEYAASSCSTRGGAGRGSVGGGRGGGGRGQGRPANKRGLGATADPGVQASITALLGARRTEEQVEEQAEPTGETIKWKYNRHDGGDQDTLVDQEQIVGRKVVYKLFGAGRPGVSMASRSRAAAGSRRREAPPGQERMMAHVHLRATRPWTTCARTRSGRSDRLAWLGAPPLAQKSNHRRPQTIKTVTYHFQIPLTIPL